MYRQRHSQEIVEWINDLLNTQYTTLDEMKSGVALLQVIHSIAPFTFDLARVDFRASTPYHFEKNLKLLQEVMMKNSITRPFNLAAVMKGDQYQDLYTLMSWFKHNYNALKERRPKTVVDSVAIAAAASAASVGSSEQQQQQLGGGGSSPRSDQEAAAYLHQHEVRYDPAMERRRAMDKRSRLNRTRAKTRGGGGGAGGSTSSTGGQPYGGHNGALDDVTSLSEHSHAFSANAAAAHTKLRHQMRLRREELDNWARAVQMPAPSHQRMMGAGSTVDLTAVASSSALSGCGGGTHTPPNYGASSSMSQHPAAVTTNSSVEGSGSAPAAMGDNATTQPQQQQQQQAPPHMLFSSFMPMASSGLTHSFFGGGTLDQQQYRQQYGGSASTLGGGGDPQNKEQQRLFRDAAVRDSCDLEVIDSLICVGNWCDLASWPTNFGPDAYEGGLPRTACCIATQTPHTPLASSSNALAMGGGEMMASAVPTAAPPGIPPFNPQGSTAAAPPPATPDKQQQDDTNGGGKPATPRTPKSPFQQRHSSAQQQALLFAAAQSNGGGVTTTAAAALFNASNNPWAAFDDMLPSVEAKVFAAHSSPTSVGSPSGPTPSSTPSSLMAHANKM